MKKQMRFVAIGADGKEKSLREWEKADILGLVEKLASERADLYEVLERLFAGKTEERAFVCSEPSPDECIDRDSGKVSSFHSTLTQEELETLACLVNDIGIFARPEKVEAETLAAFFRGEATGMQVRNLRLFCAMMTALAHHGYIGGYWQAPIYRGRLLLAYEKKGYINRSDLTTANYEVKNIMMDDRVEKIEHVIRAMKAGKRKETDMSV